MKIELLFLLVLFSACSVNPYFVRYTPNMSFEARVLEVTDGDTILIENEGQTNSVRLLFIDAMETRDNSRFERKMTALRKGGVYETKESVINLGEEAKIRLKELLPPGSSVRIDFPSSEQRDIYGRYLGVVFSGETNFNYLMVREGLAVTYFPGKTGETSIRQYKMTFLRAEEAAGRKKTGVWKYFSSGE